MRHLFRRSSTYLLYPLQHELLVFELSSRTPAPMLRFVAESDQGTASCKAFSHWLCDHTDDRFELFIDSADEVMQVDELPPLRARDRAALVRRRLRQSFRDSEFTAACDLGAGPDKKRRMLLCALRQNVALAPWLDELLEAQAQLTSISSPALLAPALGRKISASAFGLLISVHPSGIRQTLLRDGRVHFSRLAPTAGIPDAAELLAELSRTMQYLLMAQRVSRQDVLDGRLTVWVLDAGLADSTELPASVAPESLPPVPIMRVPASALGASMPDDAPGLGVWLLPELRRRLGRGYANRRVSRFASIARWQHQLVFSSLALLLVGVATQIGVAMLITQARAQAVPATATALAQQKNATLGAALASFPASAQEMRAVVDASAWIGQRGLPAPALLHIVSGALEDAPSIRLEELFWSVDAEQADGSSAAAMASSLSAAASNPAGASGTGVSSPASGDPGFALAPDSTVQIDGSVPAELSKTQANKRVEAFSNAILQACGCQLQALELPYDPAPGKGLSGSLEPSNTADPKRFVFRFIWPGAVSRAHKPRVGS